jgi:hypothetical protein
MWVLTVLVETKSLPAIPAFDSPAATSASTSIPRPLRGSASRPSVASAHVLAFDSAKRLKFPKPDEWRDDKRLIL